MRAAIDDLQTDQLSKDEQDLLLDLQRSFSGLVGGARVVSGNPSTQLATPAAEKTSHAAELTDLASLMDRASRLSTQDENRSTFVKAILAMQKMRNTPKLATNTANLPPRSYNTRRFILYSMEDYRAQYLRNRIAVQDINAFPLSEDETTNLFGELVNRDYFAVRVSFRNTMDRDILISTGMIKAYGQARVESQNETTYPSYGVPVEVVPQSREHVYSIVSDTKPYRTREWIFRSLEFTGSLATAIATGFNGAPDLIKGIGIYTGVGLPAGQKLYPDPVPQYLKNIVDYSMPDLVKVPRGTVMGHKYIFFSKRDLQAVIPDPSNLVRQTPLQTLSGTPKSELQPHVHVVYVSFDTLDVPFENVVQSPDQSASQRTDAGIGQATALSQTLRATLNAWTPGASDQTALLDGVTKGQLADLDIYTAGHSAAASVVA